MHSSIHQTQLAEGATARDRAAPKAPPGPIWFTVPNLVFMGLFLLGAMLVLIDVSLRVYEAGGAGVTDQRTVQNYADFLLDPYFLQIVWRSVVMAVTVVLATLVLGLPLAIGLSRTTGIWRALLYFAVLAPLLTSVVVRTFGWMMLLSNNGVINSTLRELEIIRLPIRIRRHVEDARTPCIPQQLTVELRPALGPDLSLKRPADVEITAWAQFLGDEIACPVAHPLLDVVPRDHEILAVVARTPNDQMDMRMGGVPVIDADPIKRRAEILLHPPDEIAGEGLQVGHVRRVVG